jgi:hypothetical protein
MAGQALDDQKVRAESGVPVTAIGRNWDIESPGLAPEITLW